MAILNITVMYQAYKHSHLVTYGDMAFSAAAGNIGNFIQLAIKLGNTVTTFKICIKTYLFNLAYPIDQ